MNTHIQSSQLLQFTKAPGKFAHTEKEGGWSVYIFKGLREENKVPK